MGYYRGEEIKSDFPLPDCPLQVLSSYSVAGKVTKQTRMSAGVIPKTTVGEMTSANQKVGVRTADALSSFPSLALYK